MSETSEQANVSSLVEWIEKANAAKSTEEVEALEKELLSPHPPFENAQVVMAMLNNLLRTKKDLLHAEGLRLGTFYSRIDQVFVNNNDTGFSSFQAFTYDDYRNCCRPKYKTRVEREQDKIRYSREQQNQDRYERKRKRSGEAELGPPPGATGSNKNERIERIMHSRGIPNADVYLTTYMAATSSKAQPAIGADQSGGTIQSAKLFEIWKTTVVGGYHSGDIAHLVPRAVEPANSFWFVTDFLFGFNAQRKWAETQCLLHGTNNKKGRKAKKSKMVYTGIKHMVTNKVLLSAQDYLDIAPCVIIVPILSVQKAINWTGEGYHAIMLIDQFEEGKRTLSGVCCDTCFTYYSDSIPKATGSDLTTANVLLDHYNKAILFAQKNRKPKEVEFSLGAEIAAAFFPKLSSTDDLDALTVRKIRFHDNNSSEGHPAPDPLLLVTKSIAVLQKRHGFDIVAAVDPREIGGPSDLSLLAEEEWLQQREAAQTYPDPIGLDIVVHR